MYTLLNIIKYIITYSMSKDSAIPKN